METLRVGAVAPDFVLQAVNGGVRMKLSFGEYTRGQNAVLAFHPLNWIPASTQQMKAYQRDLEKFAAHEARVVGVSVDSTVNTGAWERKIGPIDFPLCSDFYPHGEVARKYGVFREGPPIPGISERAVFVLDKDARIVFVRLYGFDEVPDNAECFAVLNSLRLRQEASSA